MRRFIGADAPFVTRPDPIHASTASAGAVDRERASQGPGNDLDEISHGQGFLSMYPANAILKHLEAEGTCTPNHVGLRPDSLFRAHKIDLAGTIFIHPGMTTPGATTETSLPIMLHLHHVHPRYHLQDVPRCLVDAVMPTKVARIMVGDGLRDWLCQLQLPFLQQLR